MTRASKDAQTALKAAAMASAAELKKAAILHASALKAAIAEAKGLAAAHASAQQAMVCGHLSDGNKRPQLQCTRLP